MQDLYIIIRKFIHWLDDYGELSQDQYDYWANSLGQRAKPLYHSSPLIGAAFVAPFIFLDAFVPGTRRWFSCKKRFPIADAHYAMGFFSLYLSTKDFKYYERGKQFLEVLINSRCPYYQHYCWGYPFDWVTKVGMIKAFTPLISTTPYVYEAFAAAYDIVKDNDYLQILHSIAEHAMNDINDVEISSGICASSYTPFDQSRVVNASSYRAFLLTDAAQRFNRDEYWQVAERNLNFVLKSQQSDGSWFYADDFKNHFVDHFHTCFVIKNLVKIEQLTGYFGCREATERGTAFYLNYLFDEQGLPKPFAKSAYVTLYKRELYDYAECVNLALLVRNQFPEFHNILGTLFSDLKTRWQKADGSFRTRQLLLGWNNVPYHRWAQSQMFRSLSLWYHQESQHIRIRQD